MKKLVDQSGSFEHTTKFNWESMESFETRRCPCVFDQINYYKQGEKVINIMAISTDFVSQFLICFNGCQVTLNGSRIENLSWVPVNINMLI